MRAVSVSVLTRCLLALIAATVLAGLTTEAAAARRALVIGIDQYEVPSYRTSGRTARDASQVAKVLQEDAGYETVVVVPPDADRDTFLDRLSELRNQIAAGDFVLVFFSGHGIEKFDDNWLLLSTVPASFDERPDLMREQLARNSISLNQLLRDLKPTGAGSIVVVVNACRSEGVRTLSIATSAKPGMAHIRDVPQSTAILYASSSGRDALVCSSIEDCANASSGLTVFTRRFVEQLKLPNQPIEALYRSVGAAVEADLAPAGLEQTAALYIDGFKFADRDRVMLGVVDPGAVVGGVTADPVIVDPVGSSPAVEPALPFERPGYAALHMPAYAVLAATVSSSNAQRQLDAALAADPALYQGLQPQLVEKDWGEGTSIYYVVVQTRGLRMAEDICVAIRRGGGECDWHLAAEVDNLARLARSPIHGGGAPRYDVEKALRACGYFPQGIQSEYAYVMQVYPGSGPEVLRRCIGEVEDAGSPKVGELAVALAQDNAGYGDPKLQEAGKARLDALAAAGYLDAMVLTADREFFGGGGYGPPEDKRPLALAMQAAEAGHFGAMMMLANRNWGTAAERFGWLQRAAEAGAIEGGAGLGYVLWSGVFADAHSPEGRVAVSADRQAAVDLMRRSYALTGATSVLPYLVVAYDQGMGVPRNSRLAAELLLEYFGGYGYSEFDEFDPGATQSVTLDGKDYAYSDELRGTIKRRLAGLGVYPGEVAAPEWDVADALHGLVDNWCRLSLCGAP